MGREIKSHKGYEITQEYDLKYYGTDPDADYDFVGDPGSYVQCSGLDPVGPCSSPEAVMKEIDELGRSAQ